MENIFPEVEPLTTWSDMQIRIGDELTVTEDAEIFYHLNEGAMPITSWNEEVEVC